ncbi:uncharacterized protein [Triticum aestivum]|uniref:uncharacterized protein isoform X1 n=1 Tax=Triticum aestivum TaxID=4565 RepID=UPI001D02C8AA|nr:uncharacterized protein LOC123157832 isoform X1 [Triticum aestivum]
MPLLFPAPSSNLVAEVLEEALDSACSPATPGPLPPPGALTVAAMSLSTLSRAMVRVQMIGADADPIEIRVPRTRASSIFPSSPRRTATSLFEELSISATDLLIFMVLTSACNFS